MSISYCYSLHIFTAEYLLLDHCAYSSKDDIMLDKGRLLDGINTCLTSYQRLDKQFDLQLICKELILEIQMFKKIIRESRWNLFFM